MKTTLIIIAFTAGVLMFAIAIWGILQSFKELIKDINNIKPRNQQ